ncbi:BA75_04666T0 [Komagataella pastoris]|uniref:Nuclear rim protein 1 n=1 Tax=Komagataella pastoris TaxID=4922 RepID=A0A1B2JI45_PICPA|nr:BA75_04666T0 [Komagataella pastoris]
MALQSHGLYKKGNRYIRKVSLWSKIKNYPIDQWINLNENINIVDWDQLSETTALRLGIALNVLFWFLSLVRKALRSSSIYNEDHFFKSNFRELERKKLKEYGKLAPSSSSEWSWATYTCESVATFLFLSLFIFSIINAIRVLTTTKTYKFMYHDKLKNEKLFQKQNQVSKKLPRLIQRLLRMEPNDPWTLQYWNPNRFFLRLMVLFSPIHSLIIALNGVTLNILLTVVIMTFFLYTLTTKFEDRVDQKELILKEVAHEYDAKFVIPNTTRDYKEVAIDSTDKFNPNSVEVFPKAQKTKVFLIHDSKGNLTDIDSPSKLPSSWLKSTFKPR